jgi:tetratricopeptide (TPR) repeat protein
MRRREPEVGRRSALRNRADGGYSDPDAMSDFQLSLCMIVRDEELLLRQAIESVRAAVDEIVVVDTGSVDRTRDIARECGARLFERPWTGRFDVARNAYLELARGDWVLVLDGDEKIAQRDAGGLRELTRNSGTAGYRFTVHNYTSSLDLLCDWHPNRGAYPEEEAFSQCPGYSRFQVARLFRRAPGIRYDEGYSAHTNPLKSLHATGEAVRDAGVVIHHFQCRKGGERFVAEKQLARLEMERRHLEQAPNDALALLNVGRTLFSLGRDSEALQYLDRAVAVGERDEQTRVSRAIVRYEAGDYGGAIDDLVVALKERADFADAWTVLGMAHHAAERPDDARIALERAVAVHPFHPIALNSLGVVLMDLGDTAGAERSFRAAMAVLPEHPLARENLAVLLGSDAASVGDDDESLGV